MKELSIIITAYNCEKTIYSAAKSVLKDEYESTLEVIIIDDCSKDNTFDILKNLEKEHSNLKILQTEKNTGSPSIPRNIGIENANGKYITFLDDDDYIDISVIFEKIAIMEEKSLDLLLSNLYVVNKNSEKLGNNFDVDLFSSDKKYTKRVVNVFKYLSTRVDCIFENKFLKENTNIRFDAKVKLGEDTIFYTEIFLCNPKFEYVKMPHYYYVTFNNDLENKSTTQNYSDFELNQHLTVWETVEDKLQSVDVSYYDARLSSAFRITLMSIVKYSNGEISKDSFERFSNFTIKNKKYLGVKCALADRFDEIYKTLLDGNYESFIDKIKMRILINGYDLKFALPLVKHLEKKYNVKIDEWTGHNIHNEKQSKEMLEWADIIFCEWMLGNAKWYSENVRNYQTLIIRAHRFEVGREFGFQIDFNKVDKVITVSYYFLNLFMNKFNIPKNKMMLLNNYVEANIYDGVKNGDVSKNISICGILPSRKGFYRGLELIKKLVSKNDEFKLYIIGDNPKDINWIQNNIVEKEYYDNCYKFIEENNLTDNVIFTGRLDRSDMFKNIGFVLSLSDDEEVPESFHLTPAEGVMDGGVALVSKWRGSEYIYPEYFLYDSVEKMAEEILTLSSNPELFKIKQKNQQKFISENYEVELFLEKLNAILELAVMNK